MRPFIVVSGSGRSGTSLTMQLLHACGLEVSDELIGVSEANPRGAWEDRAIFAEQARLFHALATRALPRQNSWREGPLFDEAKARLDQLLQDRLSQAQSVWGFKDPKTCLFLPLWQDLSQAHECDLRFVLCVRRAGDTIASLMTNYDHSTDVAQSIFFNRNVHALADCPPRAFVIHYEDLLGRDAGMLRQLCVFCGLPAERTDDSLQSIMANICEAELNRMAGSLGIDLAAPVLELDRMLQNLRGEVPDVDRVRREARELLAPLQHWDFIIGSARKAIQDGEAKLARIASIEESNARKIERLKQAGEARRQRLEAQLRRLKESSAQEIARIKEANARSVEELKQINTRLKAQADQEISVLRREIMRLEIQQQTLVTKHGLGTKQGSHDELLRRLGEAVLRAFERPGVRTLRLPWKLVRLHRRRDQIYGETKHGEHDELLQRLGEAVLKAFERPGLRTFRLPWKLVRLYRKREQIHVGAGMRRREEAERRLSLPVETTLEAPEVRPGAEGR